MKMEDENYIHNVNAVTESILDEEKIVTYASISKEFCIHVNICKILLERVVKNVKAKHPKIGLIVNYIISGLCEDKRMKTIVCSESELDSIRNSFRVIYFEHIYSVSKGSSSVDKVSLAAVSSFQDFILCTGLVKNNSCTVRTAEEMESLRSKTKEICQPVESQIVMKKTENNNDNKVKSDNSKIKIEQIQNISWNQQKSELISLKHDTNKETPDNKNKSLQGNQQIKSEVISPKKDTNKLALASKNKSRQGIAGFFNKPNGQKSADNLKRSKQEQTDTGVGKMNPVIKEEKMEVDNEIPKFPPKNDLKPKTTKEKESSVKYHEKKSNDKALNQFKKNAKVDKNRKRVLQVSDSESDDESPFNNTPLDNQESEDEIPPTPMADTVKITSGIINPKKRRKVVDKTYTDEDGYILTKKEVVYESCSDDETATKENVQKVIVEKHISPIKNKQEKSKKKVSPPNKNKQTTLMSFFNKK